MEAAYIAANSARMRSRFCNMQRLRCLEQR
jgi:hypothetical protein